MVVLESVTCISVTYRIVCIGPQWSASGLVFEYMGGQPCTSSECVFVGCRAWSPMLFLICIIHQWHVLNGLWMAWSCTVVTQMVSSSAPSLTLLLYVHHNLSYQKVDHQLFENGAICDIFEFLTCW